MNGHRRFSRSTCEVCFEGWGYDRQDLKGVAEVSNYFFVDRAVKRYLQGKIRFSVVAHVYIDVFSESALGYRPVIFPPCGCPDQRLDVWLREFA